MEQKMNQFRLFKSALMVLMVICVNLVGPAVAQMGPHTVLILPFKLNASQDLTYLQQGIYDMLTSRIEYGDQVNVVSRVESHQAFQKARGNINEGIARTLGNQLNADYVMFGSITVIGQNFSLDANMVDLKTGRSPIGIHDQSTGMDGVIPKINRFAEQINQQIFGRAGNSATAASTYGAAPTTGTAVEPRATQPMPTYRRHPDYLLTGKEGQQASSLNPNFAAGQGPDFSSNGFWKSPTFSINITGLDCGDVNGDGLNEIVYSDTTTVFVAKAENDRLITIAHYEGLVSSQIKTIGLLDLNRNGVPEIFVTSQDRKRAHSLILEMRGNRLAPIVQDFPYYMRKLYLADGPVIVAQKSGTSETFYGGLKVIRYSGGQYTTSGNLGAPDKANVFNFAQADLEGNGQYQYIVVDDDNYLNILSGSGEMLWRSKNHYCGTSISIQRTEVGFAGDNLGRDKDDLPGLFLPSPILITDLDKDGKKEILVAENEESFAAKLLSRYRNFKHCTMHSLSYGQLSLKENWRTRELTGGMVGYCVEDFDNNGKQDLLLAVVRSTGTSLTDAKSLLVAYELADSQTGQK